MEGFEANELDEAYLAPYSNAARNIISALRLDKV